MSEIVNELGPLPKGDRQDTLQQLSLKALQNRLPVGRFLFRDERIDDKGVDGSLEVKVEAPPLEAAGQNESMSLFTNCRAQAQLKSTDKTELNQDNSLSYPIDTSNLNYLLNGPSPIYLLWMASTGEIRYAWALDEWERLNAENPTWREQSTFTIRFLRNLDDNALDEIHSRILKEARLGRQINEILAKSALEERVVVNIDTQTLKTTDPHEIHEWLTSSGMTIVSSGYGRQVMEWIQSLNPSQREEGRIQLVAAYAQASLGRHHEAMGHLSTASLLRNLLSPGDQLFLDRLRAACDYRTGRINQQEFFRREEELSQKQGKVAVAEHRLEALRWKRLREGDNSRRAKMLEEMQSESDIIQSDDNSTPAHKLQARILLMAAAGDDLTAQFIEDINLIQARFQMGYGVEEIIKQTKEATKQLWEDWNNRADALIKDTKIEGPPILLADAITMRVATSGTSLLVQRMNAIAMGHTWKPTENVIAALKQEVKYAIEVYHVAGNIEGETRAKLLLADLVDSVGDNQQARNIAREALGVAQGMSYSQLESHAREYIDGQTIVEKFQQQLNEIDKLDEDYQIAVASDDQLRSIAGFSLNACQLPKERLPVVEREWFSQRLVSLERINFCRHLQLLQNLQHEKHPFTHYRTDPPRICCCDKHGYKSVIEHHDAKTILTAFKGTYCRDCPDREPKLVSENKSTGSDTTDPQVSED